MPARFGDPAIRVRDSSGLEFELVGAAGDERAPWTASGVGPDDADPRAAQRDDGRAIAGSARSSSMTGLLGFTMVNETDGRMRVAIGGDAPGQRD